ncbi:MAG TPA: FAD-dependent oxidoreductase [Candidatus Saccharimonadales bacterium]|nr:FAD-dependent oxidoreductase [Candidatus Saccharimonadales bacterium]
MSNSQTILVYGADWCADCHRAKYLLDKHDIAYEYKDIESDPALLSEMLELSGGKNVIPTILLTDGTVLQEPSNEALLAALHLDAVSPMKQSHDVVMIGAGPAALSAAIYTTREDIDTVLFERGVVGGLAAITDMVDNYPGFPKGVEGLTLAQNLQEQAERFGAVIELGEVQRIHDEGMYKRLETTSGNYFARAVLIATGSDYKKLGIPGEQEYYARGVHYCATCDGAFYRDKRLVVVGGGNSAVQEAIFLTRFASHIDLLVRSTLKASDVLQKDLQQKVEEGKITVHLATTTDEILGEDNSVTKVKGTHDGKTIYFETDGVFIFVGLQPNNQFLDGSGVELDELGLIKTNNRLETTVSGIFAAGDIRSGATMQIASAAGEGATAALMIREYLEERSHPTQN